MPAFQKFSVDTKFDIFRYQKCLEYGWTFLEGNPNPYQDASQECFENAPDTEQFDHALTSGALNAALSIGLMMNFLINYNIDDIIEASGLATDTVALYIQDIEGTPPLTLSSEVVMKHPLMQQELQRQEDDLAFLTSLLEDVPQKVVHILKERASVGCANDFLAHRVSI